ncbi:hypothetical protein [Lysobacter sp. CFH 32150]|uniref:hypothetical protein n=1 Tax=Lysobacter sp. CFH 32150 TaxID=2927128 RepID=UPI001FA7AB5E|nr:hypothetical protein [Lysobacter sp. CFH 32150]MCI4568024.1 hypothetical protein [Lysobacter sp. CFH 32150]
MRSVCLILGLGLLSACQPAASDVAASSVSPAQAPGVASASPAPDGGKRLRTILTCRDPDALKQGRAFFEAQFRQDPKVTCDNAGYPMRCAIAPPLAFGSATVGWFSVESIEGNRATILLPAPADIVRATLPATGAQLAAASDLGDTAVLCALAQGALDDGAIAGALSYPGESLPPMRVCAFELANGTPYCTSTSKDEASYRIDAVPRGDYLVVAFPKEDGATPGGYSECVPELDAACTDHALRVVVVKPGAATSGIDPADFYADEPDRADWPQAPAP